MKKALLLLTLIPLLGFGQTTHQLLGYDIGFDPDTLYMAPGDTVQFTSQGYHSATEIDSIDWVNNVDNSNGGFDVGFGAPTTDMWFVINNPGKYYYICGPHANMGMKGVIYAVVGNSIPESHSTTLNKVLCLPNGGFRAEYHDNSILRVFSLDGKLMHTQQLPAGQNQVEFQLECSSGVYVGVFGTTGSNSMSQKFVVP